MVERKGLPKKENFSEWFHELINRTLIDQRYPLQGFIVYRPLGYQLFDNCLKILEDLLAETGHKKCYFPLLIPERLLSKEKDHIAGFHDSVFWVTHGGLKEMEEKAALRPTSETAMYTMLSLWIDSWRDLPVKIHQSCNVYRYETKHTRPLIRDREILWNEAHTSHATAEEAREQIKVGVKIYSELFRRLCIPVIFINVVEGVFAGAEAAIEPYTVFPDGRVLEMGSVNNLGQKFSKAFDIKFKTKDGGEDYVYQTCYGVSERLIAAITAVHGDDKGLILPPEVAPIQLVIVPIIYEEIEEKVMEECKKVKEELKKEFRIELDDRTEITPGVKFYDWEMKGVPIRIEVGEKEIDENGITIVRRDNGEREFVKRENVIERIRELLEEITENMRKRAEEYHAKKIKIARNMDEVKEAIENKLLAKVFWCGEIECASKMEKSMNAPFIGTEYEKGVEGDEKCTGCGKPAKFYGFIGKTY